MHFPGWASTDLYQEADCLETLDEIAEVMKKYPDVMFLVDAVSSMAGSPIDVDDWGIDVCLAGLQKAIEKGKLPSFEKLMSTTSHQFYNLDRGTNYAQARYLLYYLQEQGLLRRYYHEFRSAQRQDPTGYRTLQKVLGSRDMAAFQRRWETYVAKLTFP